MSRKPLFNVLCECLHKIETFSEMCQSNPNKINEQQAITIMSKLIATYNQIYGQFTQSNQVPLTAIPTKINEFNKPLEEINQTLIPYFHNQIAITKKALNDESGNIFKAHSMFQREDGKEYQSAMVLVTVMITKIKPYLLPLICLEKVGKEIIKVFNFADQLKEGTNQLNRDDFVLLTNAIKNVKTQLDNYIIDPLGLELLNDKLLLPLQIREFNYQNPMQQINQIQNPQGIDRDAEHERSKRQQELFKFL